MNSKFSISHQQALDMLKEAFEAGFESPIDLLEVEIEDIVEKYLTEQEPDQNLLRSIPAILKQYKLKNIHTDDLTDFDD